MKCEHSTREEVQACALRFGPCWTNPPKTPKTSNKVNNKPNGTTSRDTGQILDAL